MNNTPAITLAFQEIIDSIIKTMVDGLKILESIRVPGYLLVNNYFVDTLKSWGMPERVALEINWHLPYPLIVAIVKVMRHDRYLA